jgi:multisubunit Na+/H+ antiporter MnhB subunit
MDLIFDSQVLHHRGRDALPEAVLASIAAYYHRATTTSRPMSYLIAVVMAILLAALVFRWLSHPGWLTLVATLLVTVPILLAAARTVPNARRLGNRIGAPSEQSRLARAIWVDHLVCLALMSAFLVLWLILAARSGL